MKTLTNGGQRGWIRKSRIRTGMCMERSGTARLRKYKLKLLQVHKGSTPPLAGFFSEIPWASRSGPRKPVFMGKAPESDRLGPGSSGVALRRGQRGHRTMGTTSQRGCRRSLSTSHKRGAPRGGEAGGELPGQGSPPGPGTVGGCGRAAGTSGAKESDSEEGGGADRAALRRASAGHGCLSVARRQPHLPSRLATAAPPCPAASLPPPSFQLFLEPATPQRAVAER